MKQLYPLKFYPVYQERLWGGSRIRTALRKRGCRLERCGESWELSAVEGFVSVVANGFLKGNDLLELTEIYMGDLVGEKVFDRFGIEFPLLVKFIDAEEDLSIQVHPGDELSRRRHGANGKTEMWYILDAQPGARLVSGFNQLVDRQKYLKTLESGKLTELLEFSDVLTGDVFFIPAGRIHAIGRGILLAEIQQTSDVTYRIYDYGRRDEKGNFRELHTALALDAIDFSFSRETKTPYFLTRNRTVPVVSCPYFTTGILEMDQPVVKEMGWLDSFILYVGVEGEGILTWEGGQEKFRKGETLLVPACLENFTLAPANGCARLLEVFIGE